MLHSDYSWPLKSRDRKLIAASFTVQKGDFLHSAQAALQPWSWSCPRISSDCAGILMTSGSFECFRCPGYFWALGEHAFPQTSLILTSHILFPFSPPASAFAFSKLHLSFNAFGYPRSGLSSYPRPSPPPPPSSSSVLSSRCPWWRGVSPRRSPALSFLIGSSGAAVSNVLHPCAIFGAVHSGCWGQRKAPAG